MIAASIENNCGEVKWKMVSGISERKRRWNRTAECSEQCKKYDGNLILKSDGNKFIAELFLNS